MRGITSTTWSVGRYSWPSCSSNGQSGHHPRPSRPDLALSSEIACARRAHRVEGDGAAEACSSAPQAAYPTTLVTLRPLLGVSDPLVPDLILGPRKPLDFGELQQPVRRDTTRFFGTMSKVPMNWAAPAIKPEPLEPQPDEYGPATSPKCAVGRPRNFTPWHNLHRPNPLLFSSLCQRPLWHRGRTQAI